MTFNFEQDQIGAYAREKIRVVSTFLQICARDIGQTEAPGNRGPWVDRINSWMHAALGSAYCVSWVQLKLFEAGAATGYRFNLPKDPSCKRFADLAPQKARIRPEEIAPGDILIWKLIGGWTGHAAVVERVLGPGRVQTLEANTSPATGTIEREGDGCYRKVRNVAGMGSLRLYAVIRPTAVMMRTES